MRDHHVQQVVSLVTGLTAATDTWAHLGGLLGGVAFGFGTITSSTAFFNPKPAKKRVKRSGIMRWLQQTMFSQYKCGLREWAVRLAGWTCLVMNC